MKQIVEYLLSKKRSGIKSDLEDYCAVIAYNQYYELLSEEWKDALIRGKNSPNAFIMKRKDAKQYAKLEFVEIYAIPDEYMCIDDFCEAYETGEISNDELDMIEL